MASCQHRQRPPLAGRLSRTGWQRARKIVLASPCHSPISDRKTRSVANLFRSVLLLKLAQRKALARFALGWAIRGSGGRSEHRSPIRTSWEVRPDRRHCSFFVQPIETAGVDVQPERRRHHRRRGRLAQRSRCATLRCAARRGWPCLACQRRPAQAVSVLAGAGRWALPRWSGEPVLVPGAS